MADVLAAAARIKQYLPVTPLLRCAESPSRGITTAGGTLGRDIRGRGCPDYDRARESIPLPRRAQAAP